MAFTLIINNFSKGKNLQSSSLIRSFLGLLVATSGSAFGSTYCPNLPYGDWKISSYVMPKNTVVAVSDSEARKRIRARVTINRNNVKFGIDDKCYISSVSFEKSTLFLGYNKLVVFDCNNRVIVPNIFIGKRCDRILASLDGPTYTLVRSKARKP